MDFKRCEFYIVGKIFVGSLNTKCAKVWGTSWCLFTPSIFIFRGKGRWGRRDMRCDRNGERREVENSLPHFFLKSNRFANICLHIFFCQDFNSKCVNCFLGTEIKTISNERNAKSDMILLYINKHKSVNLEITLLSEWNEISKIIAYFSIVYCFLCQPFLMKFNPLRLFSYFSAIIISIYIENIKNSNLLNCFLIKWNAPRLFCGILPH